MIEVRTVVPSQDPDSARRIISRLLELGAGSPQPASEVTSYVSHWAEYPRARMLIAREDGDPIGWLGVAPWPGEYATLHWLRWGPVGWPSVVATADAEEVGRQLVAHAVDEVPEDISALIVAIERDTSVDDDRLDLLRSRYAALGYTYSEAVHFVHPTTGAATPSVPRGLAVRPLRDADPNRLNDCIRDVFSGEVSAFFCGGSPDEQDAFLRGLPTSSTMDEAASVVLCQGDDLIGFSSTLRGHEGRNLLVNWIGIRPAWRRRRYASFLLRHILATASEAAYATASLSSEVRNTASMALYESQGWEVEGGERQFAKYLR